MMEFYPKKSLMHKRQNFSKNKFEFHAFKYKIELINNFYLILILISAIKWLFLPNNVN